MNSSPLVLRGLVSLAVAYLCGLLALSLIHVAAPQRTGVLALSQIFAPHLFAVGMLTVPLAAFRGARTFRLVAALWLGVAFLRFGPGLLSFPEASSADARPITVLTWNLEAGLVPGSVVTDVLSDTDAELVALEELTGGLASAIELDPVVTERFPYKILRPDPSVLGMALLSAHPITEQGFLADPPLVWARLDLGNGRSMIAVAAHPLPARIGLTALGPAGPLAYDPSERDRDILRVREVIELWLADGEDVVLLGDFNVTDREPAYAKLSAALHDAHRDAGIGTGSTWRPDQLKRLPLGILRIDYVFSSARLRPLSATTDCTPRGSDHCILHATLTGTGR